MANKSRAVLIEESIPQFIRNEYPKFAEFITLYYSQQDEYGESYEFIANILDYMDVNRTSLDYLENFAGTYLSTFPRDIVPNINKRNLISNIKQFYQSLGSEASIKFLFKILFNEDVGLYYPGNDVLRVSDGKWQNEYIIKISNNRADDLIIGLVGTEIVGQISGARGLVESVTIYDASNGFHIAECALSRISPINDYNEFITGETVTGVTLDEITSISETVYSIITGVDIIENGLYNIPGDIITVDSEIGVDGFLAVSDVESGSINSIEIIKAGIGYSVNEIIYFISSSGQGAKAVIETVGGSGQITSIRMVSPGYSYKEMPQYIINTVSGSGAILYLVSDTIGKIKTVNISNFGVNYLATESEGFPYNFPIQFSFDQTSTNFYSTAFIYNDSWNSVNYKINEVIIGQTSGARAEIKRLNINTGILGYSLLSTDDITFEEGEEIVGQTTAASGFRIYKLFGTIGSIETGSIGNYQGYYRNTDGYISGDKYIQDSYYYQAFSYAITTLKEKEEWIEPIKDLIHPAGTISFGFGVRSSAIVSYSEGGWISPRLNTVEFYKFNWGLHLEDTLTFAEFGNTQIASFIDYPMYQIADIQTEDYEIEYPAGTIDNEYINMLRKTNICFGSSIHYVYPDTDQHMLIDSINALLIDSSNTLLI